MHEEKRLERFAVYRRLLVSNTNPMPPLRSGGVVRLDNVGISFVIDSISVEFDTGHISIHVLDTDEVYRGTIRVSDVVSITRNCKRIWDREEKK